MTQLQERLIESHSQSIIERQTDSNWDRMKMHYIMKALHSKEHQLFQNDILHSNKTTHQDRRQEHISVSATNHRR